MDEQPSEHDGYVTTVKTDGGVDIVIVTTDGVNARHCPGGLTENELLN